MSLQIVPYSIRDTSIQIFIHGVLNGRFEVTLQLKVVTLSGLQR